MRTDPRIVVTTVERLEDLAAALERQAACAVLTEQGAAQPPLPPGLPSREIATRRGRHFAACACCGGRTTVALALDQLFQDRTRGRCAWFERVVVMAPSTVTKRDLETALREDALTAARFRAGP